MRRSICLCVTTLLAVSLLPGCGMVVRQYVYPPALDLGRGLRGYLYESVNAEGYTAELTEDSVDFQYDPTTQVRFLLSPGFSIAVLTDGSKLTGDQLEAHFASTRARAEEILAIARARQVPTGEAAITRPDPLPEQENQPAPSLATAEPQTSEACEQLTECYESLAKALCETGDDKQACPFRLTDEIKATDDHGCRRLLHDIPFTVSLYTADNPELQVPTVCMGSGR